MNIGVIFAGGTGQRMHSKSLPKQFLKIYDKPIIIYTLEHFQQCEDIDAIVISCLESWIEYLQDLVEKYQITKVRKIVPGGETGQLSIYSGIKAAEEISNGDKNTKVLIHDGVRPMINEKLLADCVKCVHEKGSAITAGLVTETIVVVDSDNQMVEVPNRENSRVAKAPQCFYLDDILAAHEKALSENRINFIDSCSLMKHYGYDLFMIDGPYENIKITTPTDYYTMRAYLEAKENAQIYVPVGEE